MISINGLAEMIMKIAGKELTIRHIPGPQGVRGRNSDNALIFENLAWKPTRKLEDGMAQTFAWIKEQVDKRK
jgi:nucleoside-diphosphate-sugar epimerase